MLLKEPLVNAIIIYFISKTVILGLVLVYYSFFRKKGKRSRRRPAMDLTRATAPKLILTRKDGSKSAAGGRQTKTALQQTIEETFSSN